MSEHHPEPDLHDDSGLLPRVDEHDEAPTYVAGGARRARKKRGRGASGCLAVLVALGVVAGLLYFGVTAGLDKIKDQFADPEDYTGPGTGSVTFEVASGDNGSAICRNLESEGVVASVDACVSAVNGNPESGSIQVGFYELQQEMASADAVARLVDPANLLTSRVTVREGLRLTEIVDALAEGTEFPARAYQRALRNPAALGLPEEAGGNAEGYLFPATYDIGPDDKPVDILKRMVDRWKQAAEDADLQGAAERLGYTTHELMTIASLIEAEGRGDDMPKISRVIYNRLEGPGDKGGTNGKLQIDATVAYGLGLSPGSTELTREQLDTPTPYNTRLNVVGLPPGPIEAPGDAAIKAAVEPADGPWYYYVTVDLATGETRFYEDYDGFLDGQAQYKDYCETSDRC
ncbi:MULTISPECIES: endolytic transglycosylase MltG [unclassified Nocardioides]|uniref:endolytic transglycosylase MltG n=1 Tax=unclassified Nocardioides TaxID=2615069 RepID=UPI003014601F